jgi:hypothetical protein
MDFHASMILLILAAALSVSAYQVRSTSASLILDSLKTRAYAGQSTPFSQKEGAGALFLFDPRAVPAPSDYTLLSAPDSRDLSFRVHFADSGKNIASVDYIYYPLGAFRDTGYHLSFSNGFYSGHIDSASVPRGAFGRIQIIDNNNNFYTISHNHYPSVPYTWSFKPDRWYAVRPPRGSARLLTALADRPELHAQMGEKHLFCYYKNGAFHDYTDTDHFDSLRLSEAFLVYLTGSFSFQDTLEPVFLDSAYDNPVDHTLFAGWNLIVNPYPYPISIRNIRTADTVSAFFSFSDSSNSKTTYYHVHSRLSDSNDVIEPFFGYWVHSSRAGNLMTFYPYIDAFPGLRKATGNPSAVLRVRNARSSILLGMADRGEKLRLPPGGEGTVLSSDNGLAVNLAPWAGKGFIARINPEKGLAHSFSLSGSGSEKNVLYIADEKWMVALESGHAVTLAASDYYGLFFMSGPRDFISAKIREVNTLFPESFTVSGNFPNPFNPVTHIRFGVPFHLKGKPGSFSVYDVRGRLVHQRSFSAQPGFHILRWDCRDSRGRALSSGHYIALVRIKDHVRTVRMLMVK